MISSVSIMVVNINSSVMNDHINIIMTMIPIRIIAMTIIINIMMMIMMMMMMTIIIVTHN